MSLIDTDILLISHTESFWTIVPWLWVPNMTACWETQLLTQSKQEARTPDRNWLHMMRKPLYGKRFPEHQEETEDVKWDITKWNFVHSVPSSSAVLPLRNIFDWGAGLAQSVKHLNLDLNSAWTQGHEFKGCVGLHTGCRAYLKEKKSLWLMCCVGLCVCKYLIYNIRGVCVSIYLSWREREVWPDTLHI